MSNRTEIDEAEHGRDDGYDPLTKEITAIQERGDGKGNEIQERRQSHKMAE